MKLHLPLALRSALLAVLSFISNLNAEPIVVTDSQQLRSFTYTDADYIIEDGGNLDTNFARFQGVTNFAVNKGGGLLIRYSEFNGQTNIVVSGDTRINVGSRFNGDTSISVKSGGKFTIEEYTADLGFGEGNLDIMIEKGAQFVASNGSIASGGCHAYIDVQGIYTMSAGTMGYHSNENSYKCNYIDIYIDGSFNMQGGSINFVYTGGSAKFENKSRIEVAGEFNMSGGEISRTSGYAKNSDNGTARTEIIVRKGGEFNMASGIIAHATKSSGDSNYGLSGQAIADITVEGIFNMSGGEFAKTQEGVDYSIVPVVVNITVQKNGLFDYKEGVFGKGTEFTLRDKGVFDMHDGSISPGITMAGGMLKNASNYGGDMKIISGKDFTGNIVLGGARAETISKIQTGGAVTLSDTTGTLTFHSGDYMYVGAGSIGEVGGQEKTAMITFTDSGNMVFHGGLTLYFDEGAFDYISRSGSGEDTFEVYFTNGIISENGINRIFFDGGSDFEIIEIRDGKLIISGTIPEGSGGSGNGGNGGGNVGDESDIWYASKNVDSMGGLTSAGVMPGGAYSKVIVDRNTNLTIGSATRLNYLQGNADLHLTGNGEVAMNYEVGRTTYEGEIRSESGVTLEKSGAGTLTINGELAAAGVVKVGEGKLVLNGEEHSIGDLVVEESGALEIGRNAELTVTNTLTLNNSHISGRGVLVAIGNIELSSNYIDTNVAVREGGEFTLSGTGQIFQTEGSGGNITVEKGQFILGNGGQIATGTDTEVSIEVQRDGLFTMKGGSIGSESARVAIEVEGEYAMSGGEIVTKTEQAEITVSGSATKSGVFNMSGGSIAGEQGSSAYIVVEKNGEFNLSGNGSLGRDGKVTVLVGGTLGMSGGSLSNADVAIAEGGKVNYISGDIDNRVNITVQDIGKLNMNDQAFAANVTMEGGSLGSASGFSGKLKIATAHDYSGELKLGGVNAAQVTCLQAGEGVRISGMKGALTIHTGDYLYVGAENLGEIGGASKAMLTLGSAGSVTFEDRITLYFDEDAFDDLGIDVNGKPTFEIYFTNGFLDADSIDKFIFGNGEEWTITSIADGKLIVNGTSEVVSDVWRSSEHVDGSGELTSTGKMPGEEYRQVIVDRNANLTIRTATLLNEMKGEANLQLNGTGEVTLSYVSGSTTYEGAISSASGITLNKVGGGTMDVSGGLNAAGSVKVSEGKLILSGEDNSIGSLSGLEGELEIAEDAELELGVSTLGNAHGSITGKGMLTLVGDLTLSGAASVDVGALNAENVSIGLASGASVSMADGNISNTEIDLRSRASYKQNGGSLSGGSITLSGTGTAYTQSATGSISDAEIELSGKAAFEQQGNITGGNIMLSGTDTTYTQKGGSITESFIGVSNRASLMQEGGSISNAEIELSGKAAFEQQGDITGGSISLSGADTTYTQSAGSMTGVGVELSGKANMVQKGGSIENAEIVLNSGSSITQTVDGVLRGVSFTGNGGSLNIGGTAAMASFSGALTSLSISGSLTAEKGAMSIATLTGNGGSLGIGGALTVTNFTGTLTSLTISGTLTAGKGAVWSGITLGSLALENNATLTLGSLSVFDGKNAMFNLSTAMSSAGTLILDLSGINFGEEGVYTLFTGNLGGLTLALASDYSTDDYLVAIDGGKLVVSLIVNSGDTLTFDEGNTAITWGGENSSLVWDGQKNYENGAWIDGSNAIFKGTSAGVIAVTVADDITTGSMTISSGSYTFATTNSSLTMNKLTLAAFTSAELQMDAKLNGELSLGSNATLTVSSGTLTLDEEQTLTAGSLNVKGSGVVKGDITLNGASLTLGTAGGSDAAQLKGNLTVTSGTLEVRQEAKIDGALTINGGTATLYDNATVTGTLSGTGKLTVDGSGVLLNDGGKIGTLEFTGANSAVSLGSALTVGKLASNTSGAVNANNAVTLTIDTAQGTSASAKSVIFGKNITVDVKGAGTQTLESATVNGTLKLSGGMAELAGTSSVATLTGNGGSLTIGGTANVTNFSGSLTSLSINGTLKAGQGATWSGIKLSGLSLGANAKLELSSLSVFDGKNAMFNLSTAMSSAGKLTLDLSGITFEEEGTYTIFEGQLNGLTLALAGDYSTDDYLVAIEGGKLVVSLIVNSGDTLTFDESNTSIIWGGANSSKVWDGEKNYENEAWIDGSNAVFAGTANAVIVSVAGAINTGTVTIESGAYTFTEDGGSLTMGGLKLNASTSAELQMDAEVSGTLSLGDKAALTVSEGGTLTLSKSDGNSLARGSIELRGGKLELGGDLKLTGATLTVSGKDNSIGGTGALILTENLTLGSGAGLSVSNLKADGITLTLNGSSLSMGGGALSDVAIELTKGSELVQVGGSISGKVTLQDATLTLKGGSFAAGVTMSGTEAEIDLGGQAATGASITMQGGALKNAGSYKGSIAIDIAEGYQGKSVDLGGADAGCITSISVAQSGVQISGLKAGSELTLSGQNTLSVGVGNTDLDGQEAQAIILFNGADGLVSFAEDGNVMLLLDLSAEVIDALGEQGCFTLSLTNGLLSGAPEDEAELAAWIEKHFTFRDVLTLLGFKVERAEGGALVISGSTDGAYLVSRDGDVVDDPFKLGRYDAVLVDEDLDLNIDIDEDSGRNSLLNHVDSLGTDSDLNINKSGKGDITVEFHNEEGRDTTLGGDLTEKRSGSGRADLKKTGKGRFTVGGRVTTDDDLWVAEGGLTMNGDENSVGGDLTVGDAMSDPKTEGSLEVNGNLTVGGDMDIDNGDATLNGDNTHVSGDVNVGDPEHGGQGSLASNGGLDVDGDLNIKNGDAELNGDNTHVGGNVNVGDPEHGGKGGLVSNGDLDIDGDLNVKDGDAELNGDNTHVGGDVNVGDPEHGGRGGLVSNGDLDIDGDLNIKDGDVVMNGEDNHVGGDISFGDEEHGTEGNLELNGSLTVDGDVDLSEGCGSITGDGELHIGPDGSLTMGDNVDFNGPSLDVDGTLDMNGQDVAMGSLSGNGTVKGPGSITVDGGEGDFSGKLEGSGSITVTGEGTHQSFTDAEGPGWDLEVKDGGRLTLTESTFHDVEAKKNGQLEFRAKGTGAKDHAGANVHLTGNLVFRNGSTTTLTFNMNADELWKQNRAMMVSADGAIYIERQANFVLSALQKEMPKGRGGDLTNVVVMQGSEIHVADEFPEVVSVSGAMDGRAAGESLNVELAGLFYIYYGEASLTVQGNELLLSATRRESAQKPGAGFLEEAIGGAGGSNAAAGAGLLDRVDMTQDDTLAELGDALGDMLAEGKTAQAARVMAAVAGSTVTAVDAAQRDALREHMKRMREHAAQLRYYIPQDKSTHVWIEGVASYANVSTDGYNSGYKMNSWGGSVGADFAVSDDLTVGLSLTAMYGDLSADAAESAEGKLDTRYFSLWAHTQSDRWGHSFIVTMSTSDASLDRTVNYGKGDYTAQGSTRGRGYGAMYELSYDMPLSETSFLQSLMSISMMSTTMDAYAETGAGGVGLAVGEQQQTVTTVAVGARWVSRAGADLFGSTAVVELSGRVTQDLGDTRSEADNALLANPGYTRKVRGAEVGSTSLQFGASVSVPVSAETQLFVNGNADLRSGAANWNIGAGVRCSF